MAATRKNEQTNGECPAERSPASALGALVIICGTVRTLGSATSINAIGIAGGGCSLAWQGWDPVGVLASAGKATPLGMFKKALRGEDKGSSHAKQRMALLPSVDTVPGPGWAGCVPVLVSSAAPAPWLQR